MAGFSQLDRINNPIWYKNPRKPKKLRWAPLFFLQKLLPKLNKHFADSIQGPFSSRRKITIADLYYSVQTKETSSTVTS